MCWNLLYINVRLRIRIRICDIYRLVAHTNTIYDTEKKMRYNDIVKILH